MALIITDKCINCGVCETECPNHAIFPPAEGWDYAIGTHLEGMVSFPNGESVNANKIHPSLSYDYYFIIPGKCTECVGFHDSSRCAAVCPVDCCLPDPDHWESRDELMSKKKFMHDQ
ncbi:MAG: 4Fe-4S dicluster domain-containing protein [Cyclobacteriaceae bacterium]|nr:4Fe-4S dicluster domain-containing protein [Cyclobacteriaceae bacterium]